MNCPTCKKKLKKIGKTITMTNQNLIPITRIYKKFVCVCGLTITFP